MLTITTLRSALAITMHYGLISLMCMLRYQVISCHVVLHVCSNARSVAKWARLRARITPPQGQGEAEASGHNGGDSDDVSAAPYATMYRHSTSHGDMLLAYNLHR